MKDSQLFNKEFYYRLIKRVGKKEIIFAHASIQLASPVVSLTCASVTFCSMQSVSLTIRVQIIDAAKP